MRLGSRWFEFGDFVIGDIGSLSFKLLALQSVKCSSMCIFSLVIVLGHLSLRGRINCTEMCSVCSSARYVCSSNINR